MSIKRDSLDIDEIERELKNGLLATNYNYLTKNSGARCTDLVVEYIHNTDTVADQDVHFVKKLTKVAHNITEVSDRLDNLISKMYQFNIEGAEMIQKGLVGFNESRQISLESHLMAYAADAAEEMYAQTGDIEWAIKWYQGNKTSGDVSKDTEFLHSAHSYGFAADAARIIFFQTKELKWAIRWYEGDKISADMTKLVASNHSAYSYGFAGDATKILFEETNDMSWAEKCYECYKTAGDMMAKNDPAHSAHMYCFAGDAAKTISDITNEKSWTRAVIDNYSKFVAYFEKRPHGNMKKILRKKKIDIEFLKYFV